MPIEVKELIVKGKINGSSSLEEKDIIEIIEKLQGNSENSSSLSESLRRSLVEECVQDVLLRLETKIDY